MAFLTEKLLKFTIQNISFSTFIFGTFSIKAQIEAVIKPEKIKVICDNNKRDTNSFRDA